jgi:acyl-CoA thioester hydrolase
VTMAMSEPQGCLAVSISIPVAWGDMDAFQHVNNVTYARWLESGRIAYFTHIGFMQRMGADGIGPILARLSIEYCRPVTFPDVVRVEVGVAKIGRRSFSLRYRIWSESQQAEVATAEDVTVVFDYRASRTTFLDDRLRDAIGALERAA